MERRTTEKANNTADISDRVVEFPLGTVWLDGTPFDPNEGGIAFTPDGRYWSVSKRENVPLGYEVPPKGSQPDAATVWARRAAEIIIVNDIDDYMELMRGLELEFASLDKHTGSYVAMINENGVYMGHLGQLKGLMPELYTIMGETRFDPSNDPEEMWHIIIDRFKELTEAADKDGIVVTPMSAIAQEADMEALMNHHPYIEFVAQWMEQRTHVPTVEFFRVLSSQFHQEAPSTERMLATCEALLPLLPLLSAASWSSPFLPEGGIPRILQTLPGNFTARQAMERARLTANDITSPALSNRYTLRTLGSDAGGTPEEHAPPTLQAALELAHQRLRSGEISTIDRLMGTHRDMRARKTLANSRGTLENCNPDTYAGSPLKLWAAQQFYGGIALALDHMMVTGQDPRRLFPGLYGRGHLHDPLGDAHQRNLLSSRHGMDAVINGKPVFKHFDELEKMARMTGTVPEQAIEEMRRSFISNQQCMSYIWQRFRETGGHEAPSLRWFHESGLGTPAIYMIARYQSLKERGYTHDEAVRDCEFDLGLTFTDAVQTAPAELIIAAR